MTFWCSAEEKMINKQDIRAMREDDGSHFLRDILLDTSFFLGKLDCMGDSKVSVLAGNQLLGKIVLGDE